MKIKIHLSWCRGGSAAKRAFKSAHCHAELLEYVKRISRFCSCEIAGALRCEEMKKAGSRVWVCDGKAKSRMLSSEETAKELKKLLNAGVKELHLVIGGPDGFSEAEHLQIKSDLRWSFGNLTLPHELACVVAGEQIYRAWTILRGLPYHLGH